MSPIETVNKFSRMMKEKSDCAVKAVAIAAGIHYVDVHGMMASEGRRHRDGTPNPITYSVLEMLGFRLDDVTNKYKARTVRTLGREMKNVSGSYLVWVRGHILCIRDGEVCDWTNGRLHRIQKIAKVVYDNSLQMAAKDES